jgi:hypothetical protein
MTTLQLSLFPDISVRPTIAMQRGDSFLAQCGYCGLLVCVPGVGVDGTHRGATNVRQLGPCPSCRRDQGWWQQEPGVGPFKPRTWPLADVVARCPQCGLEWTDSTPHSWWLRYDRCYSCMAPPDADSIPTGDELVPFEIGPRP